MLAISQDAEGLSILWDRMLGAPRGLRGFAKTHVFQQAVIPSGGSINRMSAMVVSNGCQQWLSAMAVSNGCQQWLSAMAVNNGCQQWLFLLLFVFPPKTACFEGFGPNGRHHANQREKTIRMVKFPAQTELISGISDFGWLGGWLDQKVTLVLFLSCPASQNKIDTAI